MKVIYSTLAAALALSHAMVASRTHSFPLLAFSSEQFEGLNQLEGGLTTNDHSGALTTLFNQDDICSFDAVIMVSVPGFHASHLRSSGSAPLLSRFTSSASRVHLPYLAHESPKANLATIAEQLAERCGARFIEITTEEDQSVGFDMSEKHVLSLDPHSDIDIVSNRLSAFANVFTSHLVVVSSLPSVHEPSKLGQRAVTSSTSAKPTRIPETDLPTPIPAESYRLFTPGLLFALLIVFSTVLPLALVVINILAGIKSPIQAAKFKAPGAEKKNQ